MVKKVDKGSDFKAGSTISSHVVFIYSLLIAFILAMLLGIFVTLMQRKYEAEITKQTIMQNKPVAGKFIYVFHVNGHGRLNF